MPTNTLTSQPVAGVLQRLLTDATRSHSDLIRRRQEGPISSAEPGTAEFWSAFRDMHLAVSPATGRLLYLLGRARGTRSVVEFGTSFGVSTIYLAAAVRDNGGGRVVGTEFEESKADAARTTLTAAGLSDLVEIRVGDALETLAEAPLEDIDLVLLDGTKSVYLDVLHLLEPHLAPRALIVADNAGRSPDYLAYVRGVDSYLSLTQADEDVELTLYLGP